MTPEQRTTPPAPDVAEPPPDTSTALALPGLLAALTEAHRGEVAALRDALAEARARADLLQREADDLRAQLEAPPEQQPPPLSPWARIRRWLAGFVG